MEVCAYLGDQVYQGAVVDAAKAALRDEDDDVEGVEKDDRAALRACRVMGKQKDAQKRQRAAEKKHRERVERHARGVRGHHSTGPDPRAAAGRLLLERALSFSIDDP